MLTISDAVFFLDDKRVIKEMLMNEFEALLDGIVELPEYKGSQVNAIFLQIDEKLKVRGLVSFYISFNAQGLVESDWNIPLQQLLQSASRGPDLGSGKIRLVCRSHCTVPWHKHSLWDPSAEVLKLLVRTVSRNRLGLVEVDSADEVWDVPDIGLVADPGTTIGAPPVLAVEPPVLGSESIIPTLEVPQSAVKAALITDNLALDGGVAADKQALESSAQTESPNVSAKSAAELSAMKAAYSVKVDRLQKTYDDLNDKYQGMIQDHQDVVSEIKQQVKEQLQESNNTFKEDLDKREQLVQALKTRLKSEQKRYSELKEQQAELAVDAHQEREGLLVKMQSDQDVGSEKIAQLQQAFKNELDSRLDAETSKANDGLAVREVELFYRDEQLALLRDDISKLKVERQSVIAGSGNKILTSLEDNGVTLVAFHEGVGHITIPSKDVGRYLDQRTAYLSERCQVTVETFNAWHVHYNQPCCQAVDKTGKVCGVAIDRVDLASSFKQGFSEYCSAHVHSTQYAG